MYGKNLPKVFGSNVFSETVMKEMLPSETYASIKKTIETGEPLDPKVAQAVATAMKEWAVEKGATHFTHWFQPLTGITAEKHDAFISPCPEGKVILEFSGKELIKGEPDASSFPSGGLRATFEARGYTAWDPTSYAFVKDGILYIPTVFCSYTGEVLDNKTPLLRSMEAVSKQAIRILKILGNKTAVRVITTVGPEQEYFLVDQELFAMRKDLIFTGRTLFGARSPKGQEMEDHYFGNIKERVSAFMKELNEELWKLGVYAKTEHNEVAPSQHELAPIFSTTNIATDHNQITMEMMRKVAKRHGLECLLHEKPFAGINGSGKHNNWSISTNDGENLLNPGKDPIKNLQFLLFLSAVIKAVDEYGEVLRVSVATAANDHRLGANEAPPAIVSVFLGEQLTAILDAIEKGEKLEAVQAKYWESGVASLPILNKDNTDRNRTSPFAFTGNKFEFRMPGGSQSISGVNTFLNTIVAEELSKFADRLEKSKKLDDDIMALVKETVVSHKRIIFNGNNYSEDWVKEAEKRGLPNLRSAVEALPVFVSKKSIDLFTKHNVFTETEIRSRYEVLLEEYAKTINIEALTAGDIAKKEILPSCLEYSKMVFEALAVKKASGLAISTKKEEELAVKLSKHIEALIEKIDALDKVTTKAAGLHGESLQSAKYYRDYVIPAMSELRAVADELELLVGSDYWPFPTYTDMLFGL